MTAPKRPARRADKASTEDQTEIQRLPAEEDATESLETVADEGAETPDFADIEQAVEENPPAAEPAPAADPDVIVPTGVSHAKPRARYTHTIHFLQDGMTFGDKVYVTGEELTVVEGTPEWEKVHDANGYSWMSDDKWRQMKIYGRQMFDQGPWQGEEFDLEDPNLSEADKETLRRVIEKKAIRNASPSGSTSEIELGRPSRTSSNTQKTPSFLSRG